MWERLLRQFVKGMAGGKGGGRRRASTPRMTKVTTRPPRSATVLTKPEQIAPYIVANFDQATESEIAAAHAQVMRADPRSAELGLIYALRVSKLIPTAKTMKTLVSRWQTAYCGPQNRSGLQASRHSPNFDGTYRFLFNLYLSRFSALAQEITQKAESKAAALKTTNAKLNAINAGIRKIHEVPRELRQYVEMEDVAEAWRVEAERWTNYLAQLNARIEQGEI